MERH